MIFSALILGLISSLHCVAMCGPIAMMLPVSNHNPEKKALQVVIYHLGRITAYATIGLMFGLLGSGLYLAGFQQWLSIVAGIAMVCIAVVPGNFFAGYNFSRTAYKINGGLKAALGSRLRNRSFQAMFTAGVLNGLLPCGMVYAALFGALAMKSIPAAAGYMALFGLGTVPLMSSIIYVNGWVTVPFRNAVQKTIPYAMVILGIAFIARGLYLGIPNLSPSALDLFVQPEPQCR